MWPKEIKKKDKTHYVKLLQPFATATSNQSTLLTTLLKKMSYKHYKLPDIVQEQPSTQTRLLAE